MGEERVHRARASKLDPMPPYSPKPGVLQGSSSESEREPVSVACGPHAQSCPADEARVIPDERFIHLSGKPFGLSVPQRGHIAPAVALTPWHLAITIESVAFDRQANQSASARAH